MRPRAKACKRRTSIVERRPGKREVMARLDIDQAVDIKRILGETVSKSIEALNGESPEQDLREPSRIL